MNGAFTSLPVEVQIAAINTVDGFECAKVAQTGYAVEYDVIRSFEISQMLELRVLTGLFLAGQICGTTGYEEASAQG